MLLTLAAHSSTLAWKIPWTGEPGRLQFMGSQRVRHDWVTSLSLSFLTKIGTIQRRFALPLLKDDTQSCEAFCIFNSQINEKKTTVANKLIKTICLVAQLYLTLCGLMTCSLPAFCVHGIFQARIWNGLPFPTPGDLPDPGIEPTSLGSPALVGRFFTTAPPRKR